MSNPGSSNNSNVSSPHGSNLDLRDDELNDIKARKGGRMKKIGGSLDIDDVEHTVRSAQEDAEYIKSEVGSIRAQSQGQTRRIHDLQLQFEEARVRIDKLLRRTTRSKSDYDLGISPALGRRTSDLSSSEYPSSNSISLSSMSVSSSAPSKKSEITINPVAAPKPQSFGVITLNVNVDEDEDEA